MKKFAGRGAQLTEPSVDVVLMILKAAVTVQPGSTLLTSFMQQYQERGGLSKKQLEGLLSKAKKLDGISAAHLATLEAIILKKPTRYKANPVSVPSPPSVDTHTPLIAEILSKYPEHKRVMFFKMRVDKKEPLTMAEQDELRKFAKLLLTAGN